ncbi:MAG: hypothetical protein DI598_08305 [Pseudopedobacter saltans]|uniref:Nicotinamide riboside transporter PnuC n=1 Tax=Pseudopedobacter saltans TaxID=151895 RepID=A0A2W5H0N9_9SPHI|nr:MAG: hypothetical protein DI598_08305 [Pseudopedobacter saltans]
MTTSQILEYVGVALWIVYLVLAVQEIIWCWIFGILASLLNIFNFYEHQIYAEAVVNVYYVLAAIYGWHHWSELKSKNESARVPVQVWSIQKHVIFYISTAIIAFIWGTILHLRTDSPRPYIDASTASFSFLTTYMEARKILTTWINWFVINIFLVFLQIDRNIPTYAALSAFFAIMSIRGFYRWRKSYLSQKTV